MQNINRVVKVAALILALAPAAYSQSAITAPRITTLCRTSSTLSTATTAVLWYDCAVNELKLSKGGNAFFSVLHVGSTSTYVTLDSAQTITGAKTFSSNLNTFPKLGIGAAWATIPGLGVDSGVQVRTTGDTHPTFSLHRTTTGAWPSREYVNYIDSSARLVWRDETASATRMAITDAGNFGLGILNPSFEFHLQKSKDASGADVIAQVENTHAAGSVQFQLKTAAADGSAYFKAQNGTRTFSIGISSDDMFKIIDGSDRFVIDGSGNIGIGIAPVSGIPLTVSSAGVSVMRTRSTNASGGHQEFMDNVTARGYLGYGSVLFTSGANTDFGLRSESALKFAAGGAGVDMSIDSGGVTDTIGGLKIGTGATITKHLSATATWDPASIAVGAVASTDVTVTGVASGDPCIAGFTSIGAALWMISAHVVTADSVRVVLQNKDTIALDPASGTVRASCNKY